MPLPDRKPLPERQQYVDTISMESSCRTWWTTEILLHTWRILCAVKINRRIYYKPIKLQCLVSEIKFVFTIYKLAVCLSDKLNAHTYLNIREMIQINSMKQQKKKWKLQHAGFYAKYFKIDSALRASYEKCEKIHKLIAILHRYTHFYSAIRKR